MSLAVDDVVTEDGKPNDFGSFVSSDDEIEIEEMCEPIERYANGIYYPICIGDVLAGTYRVIHKLGWGGFSTVWMAHDLKRQKLVALKIGIPGDTGERELNMQREILHRVKDTSRYLTFLDTFSVPGMNGTHLVMVFPVRGPSLHNYMRDLEVKTRMIAAKQLLLALESLHDAGIVHCDLNSGSMLWDIGNIDECCPKMAYQIFGRPRKAPVWVETWKPGELVSPIQVDKKLLQGNIFLADFGLAIKTGSPVKCPSFASDMWSYMCLFAELHLGCVPFRGRANATALSNLVRSLGPLPPQWDGMYDAGDTPEDFWYDQTQTPHTLVTLEEITKRARPGIVDSELKLVVSVLLKGFTYLPENRLTAAELLQDKDFNAIMELYGC
ncbi:kinase domain-containing protein [Metarhizium acridum CQMa 102]|uniref:non-specific serine/threonine protein kinase n=1 Tax=Metarhizium acridum (strain CQMa 102) TaxID=655827 RepID=E9EGV7_METAQ|nr:kinase domain-containing protein [Metarhizium acridum CQMa 102]EFY84853.1 kinase domain-containing protein [Metarhizium acridum CQMa 102]